ncbi:ABC transporter ATP-binding protein [Chitinivibrio alkaliphilus]|uniref:ABC transporter, ATP-binding protein n=1 Tax=Chitinivibrio alkaliphilus ACht1 TaxID=1313304 RepID=U7D7G1_9BACT|nr:ABC transporter ATP-binding protein [Chitinivibrio alkaliphilus]ERP31042.1 ABC transporter, ATP-binding protein [Chitinivibrio alkaliphilus ACht1]
MSIIEVAGLTKCFDDITAVNKASFSVKRGEVFGFLGPNGAGKTTTISMLTGLARPTAGSIRIAGYDGISDIKKAHSHIGVVPDESNLYPEMSGYENLVFCASLYGMCCSEAQERARLLLDEFGLISAKDRSFGVYSKGMKRRLTIAAGIIHNPRILFLDEPTTGIDVVSARHIRRLIEKLHHQKTTIFLTTHYIEDAQRLCNRIAFIAEGRILALDTVENLLDAFEKNIVLPVGPTVFLLRMRRPLKRSSPICQSGLFQKKRYRLLQKKRLIFSPLCRFLKNGISPSMRRLLYVRFWKMSFSILPKGKKGAVCEIFEDIWEYITKRYEELLS